MFLLCCLQEIMYHCPVAQTVETQTCILFRTVSNESFALRPIFDVALLLCFTKFQTQLRVQVSKEVYRDDKKLTSA